VKSEFRNLRTNIQFGFLLMVFILAAAHLAAQESHMPLVSPQDSTLPVTSDSNYVVKKNTATQSISALDSSGTDSSAQAQVKKPLHSARKAAYLSAVLPGLGQAYNKKYWKIPVIYAGFGGFGFAVYYTAWNFTGYRAAYRAQVAYNPNINAQFNGINDVPTLKAYRDYFKKYLDISGIGIVVWYLLNVVDATVDAHLMGWNMKDDLSITWNPTLITSPNYNTAAGGLAFTLHF